MSRVGAVVARWGQTLESGVSYRPFPMPDLPTSIDLRALARNGEALGGDIPLTALERLAPDLPVQAGGEGGEGGGAAGALLRWQVRAEWRDRSPALAAQAAQVGPQAEPDLWLHLVLAAHVPQVCQRCLQPYAQPVQVDRWFRFVKDEASAEAQDDEAEEDLLVFEPRFDLLALVEDELLMDLPLVPMHETCPQPLSPRSTGALAVPEERPHPFAGLAALKRHNNGGAEGA